MNLGGKIDCNYLTGLGRTGIPPAQNQYMQERNLGELIFA